MLNHDEILRQISKDEVLQLLKEVILNGWPADKKSLPAVLNPHYSYRDELSVYDDRMGLSAQDKQSSSSTGKWSS